MGRMSEQEMQAFLEEPHFGLLITLQRDGSPQAAPIWFEYRDGCFLVWTSQSTRRFKNIVADPRVVLSISAEDEPYRYVTVEGTITVSDVDVKAIAMSLATRYKGLDQGTAFVKEHYKEGASVVLVLNPSKLLAWKSDD